jgi:hypothetical protein
MQNKKLVFFYLHKISFNNYLQFKFASVFK